MGLKTKLRQVTVINELGIYKLAWTPEPAWIGLTLTEIFPREMGSDQTVIAHLWTITALHDRFATHQEILEDIRRHG